MAISSGVYGLAGVLIGGGITTSAQVYLEHRRERRDGRAERHAVRAAKRQVAAELFDIVIALTALRGDPRSRWARHVETVCRQSTAWDNYRELLANDSCFLAVHMAYFRTRAIAGDLKAGEMDAVREEIDAARELAKRALDAVDEDHTVIEQVAAGHVERRPDAND